MRLLLLLCVCLLALNSCEKDQKLQGEEYLVFGTYNGFCQGNCTSLFKLEDGKLFQDDMSTFVPGMELKFINDPLSQTKYELAENAYEELPMNLVESSEKSFGCPGCVDQDIIYIEYFDGADKKQWQIDTEIDAIPEYLREYAQEIISITASLSE